MATRKGAHTKRPIKPLTISTLAKQLRAVGANVSITKKRISVPRNALGIYKLGCLDSLVHHHGFRAVTVNPDETGYTVSLRTLRKQEKRRKAVLLRKQLVHA